MKEVSDDGKHTGFDIKATFQATRVNNISIMLTPQQQVTRNFIDPRLKHDFQTSVTCWSPTCPGYVKVNEYSIFTDFNTNIVPLNQTFIYLVEIDQLSKKNLTAFTYTFTMTVKKNVASPTKGINIIGDFYEWYKANKNKLPFYAPPPKVKEDEVVIPEGATATEIARIQGQAKEKQH
jgi:hypothetical protein